MEDKENLRILLKRSVFDVLEKMFFVFLEGRREDTAPRRDHALSIHFAGYFEGELLAYFSEELAQVMIENSLSLSPQEVTDQIRQDCMKECMNMICGDFLQKYEPDRLFNMSLPTYLGTADALAGKIAVDAIVIALEGEDGQYFEICLQDRVSAGA